MWVFEEFEKSVAQYGDHPFLHIPATATVSYSGTTIDLTYAQSSSLVGELKTLYSGRGYGLGHRVGLVLDNRAEFFLHFFALNALGVSVVPISSELPLDDMSYLLSHSDIGVIIALPMHLEQTATAASTLDMPVAVVSNDNLDELSEAVMPVGIGKTTSTTEAAMVYTSGTTGTPKGCMLSNEYFVSLGQWYKELGGLCAVRAGKERLITPLPLNHMNALACSSMAVMMTGGCLIQLDRFHPSTWWQTVRESKASIIHYLGVMPAMLLNTPPAAHDNLGDQIRFGFGAGADPAHQEAFEKRFGFPLIEAWAMTETGAGACLTANHEPRHVGTRCIGRATDDVECRLVDENDQDVSNGEAGELLVRAAGDVPRRGFFSGYYKDEAATSEAWRDGWFHTGDVVRIGKDNSFHFVDRRKNIIRRSGENIAAVEVEGVLFQHPAVKNCAVAPVPDEIRGEEVMACVELNNDANATEETAQDIFRAALTKLAYFKTPGYIAFVTELPTTASQKIRRGEVKKTAANAISSEYCYDLRPQKRRPRAQSR